MRLTVDGRPGELAERPEDALRALADLAGEDGADPAEWLEKALRSAGATGLAVELRNGPRHAVAGELTERAVAVYRRAMALASGAVLERLERAARDGDLDTLVRLAHGER